MGNGLFSKFRQRFAAQSIWTLLAVGLLFISCGLFFSYQSPELSNNIDGSWRYTLSALRHSPQHLGTDILFTYGPVFERTTTYPTPQDNFLDYIVGVLLFTWIFLGALYVLFKFKHLFTVEDSRFFYLSVRQIPVYRKDNL